MYMQDVGYAIVSLTRVHLATPVFYMPKPEDNDIRGNKWKIENK